MGAFDPPDLSQTKGEHFWNNYLNDTTAFLMLSRAVIERGTYTFFIWDNIPLGAIQYKLNIKY